MSSNLPLVRQSRRGRGGRKLKINIPSQQIHANTRGGLINEGDVMSSEYGRFLGLSSYVTTICLPNTVYTTLEIGLGLLLLTQHVLATCQTQLSVLSLP